MALKSTLLIAALAISLSAPVASAETVVAPVTKDQYVELCKTQGGGPKYCGCMATVTEETVGLNGEKAADASAQAKMAERIQECVPLAGQ